MAEHAVATLGAAFAVHDMRSAGPVFIPSGYEDDFNFAPHVLGRMVARCVSADRGRAVLASAAATLRLFREAVEESYKPGDLRRCRAVNLDQERVYPFSPRISPLLGLLPAGRGSAAPTASFETRPGRGSAAPTASFETRPGRGSAAPTASFETRPGRGCLSESNSFGIASAPAANP